MIPGIRKIGSYFRKQIGAELTGRHRCAFCDEPTDPTDREWSPYLRRYLDRGCIPAIVTGRGPSSISHWLETGELLEGTRAERSLVIMTTASHGVIR